MELDNHTRFTELDPEDMLSQIDGLPDQLQTAWGMGLSWPLPDWEGIERVVISGMGGSAIGADLLTAYALSQAPVPIFVHRDYGLPYWAQGPSTLVIASSHSGNTEETLSAFEHAKEAGCLRLAISTGGSLAHTARSTQAALWTFEHAGQPRAAVGFSFSLLLAALARLRLVPDPTSELHRAIAAMRQQQNHLGKEVPVVHNPAKRQAGQLIGRIVTVVGSGLLAPVARRWKGQINELAKAAAQFEVLPEADHNTLAGVMNPTDLLNRYLVIFIRSTFEHPRNQLRSDLTRKVFMLEGLPTDYFDAHGDIPLAHMWTALHFGDYMAYYLAIAYDMDPTPVAAIEGFKQELSE